MVEILVCRRWMGNATSGCWGVWSKQGGGRRRSSSHGNIDAHGTLCEATSRQRNQACRPTHPPFDPACDLRVCLLQQRECFWVKHYAGKVKYTVHGWVERNMDSIPSSFNDTLQSSTHQARPVYPLYLNRLWRRCCNKGGTGGVQSCGAALVLIPLVAHVTGRTEHGGGGHLWLHGL